MAAKYSLGVVLYSVMLSSTAMTQPERSGTQNAFGIWLVGATKDSVSLCASYSVSFSRLVFLRSEEISNPFTTTLGFSANFIDSMTGKSYYAFKRKEINAMTFERTASVSDRAGDFVLVTLPRSSFRVAFELGDERQGIIYAHRGLTTDLTVPGNSMGESVIFMDSVAGDRYHPTIPAGVVMFPGPMNFILTNGDTSPAGARAELQTAAGKHIAFLKLKATRRRMIPVTNGDSFYFIAQPDPGYKVREGYLKMDTLTEGRYKLRIQSGGSQDSLLFNYWWSNKPGSLRHFETAFMLLKYIVPDSEYSAMESGNDKERREKFDSFWKLKDPTPGTTYNELETQYYERADYANEHFPTAASRNGAFTDRGKAYILYGKPESTKRVFKDNATLEIWDYPKLRRSLIFKEEGFGDFHLYQTEKL